MKVPEDRNPCLTFVAAEKKPPSKFTKKGEVLEDTHEKAQRGSRVQRCCSHVVPEDRNPCLTLFSPEKKPALRFTKKGEVLKSTHEIAMEAIRSRPSPSRDLANYTADQTNLKTDVHHLESKAAGTGQAGQAGQANHVP